MHKNMKHIENVGRGRATFSDEQVQMLCCILMRSIQLLMWMMKRPMRAPHEHSIEGASGPMLLAREASDFLEDLQRVLAEGELIGSPKE